VAWNAAEVAGGGRPAATADIARRIFEATGPAAGQESGEAGRRACSPAARQHARAGASLVQG